MKKSNAAFATVAFLLLSACTEAGETTGIGAATGGVLGAGLGAIVGNQTGDAATGMVIGAVAGASAGAAVGNAIEAQQRTIQTQDEAIERQQKMIQAQGSELAELRRLTNERRDSAGYSRASGAPASAPLSARTSQPVFPAENPQRTSGLIERSLPVEPAGEAHGSYNWNGSPSASFPPAGEKQEALTAPPAAVAPSRLNQASGQPGECMSAFDEAEKARQSQENAEKLFHFRRALRLCPDEALFHNGLGEVYLSLGRRDDAQFEFNEALRLDPQLGVARSNLEKSNVTQP